MSANIYATPVKPIEKLDIDCAAPSYFMRTCEKVFGGFPVELSTSDLSKLEVLAALSTDAAGDGSPWSDIIKYIENYGSIRVWADY